MFEKKRNPSKKLSLFHSNCILYGTQQENLHMLLFDFFHTSVKAKIHVKTMHFSLHQSTESIHLIKI